MFAALFSSGLTPPLSGGQIFMSEFLGTAVLLLLGGGVVAAAILPKTKGNGGGWLLINFGTLAKVVGNIINPEVELSAGVPVTGMNIAIYVLAQFLGAFVGAVVMWLTYKTHFDEDCDPATKLAVFSTGPAIRNYGWNLVTEIVGTAMLILWIYVSGYTESALGPLGVAIIIELPGWPHRLRHQPRP